MVSLVSQLSITDHKDSQSSNQTITTQHDVSISVESDVLPPYESQCPVNPCEDDEADQSPKVAALDNRDTVAISTQKGDDLKGSWFVISQLGEGAYGDVKLIEDVHQHRLLAMKIIKTGRSDPEESKKVMDLVQREILVHKYLYHDNVIRFVGSRTSQEDFFIFLEYACGGELYDRIEPDFGVPRDNCHKWFVQLINGMDYLHQRGILHRDIKPENLLLNEKDDLKISDFGLATVFRKDGRLRMINTRRGTPAYVAPEVFIQDSFHAQPLDIWSAGIVLVTMVSGELPWDQATMQNESFCLWKMATLTISPWNKLPSECLALLRKMLDPNPDTRVTITNIRVNHWYRRGFTDRALGAPAPKRIRYGLHVLSVPQRAIRDCKLNSSCPADDSHIDPKVFSQPVRLEDLLISQTQGVEGLMEQSPFARMVKRITRFYISCGVQEVVETLSEILEQMHMELAHPSAGSYTVTGQDRHKGPLAFRLSFVQNQNKLLMDFRLSKGDGLEFKRIFAILRQKLDHIIAEDPVAWSNVTSKKVEV